MLSSARRASFITVINIFEFDDRAPSEYRDTPGVDWTTIQPTPCPIDYQWLEKLLPYDPSLENNGPYWFIRFK
jgi:hypothetical protein